MKKTLAMMLALALSLMLFAGCSSNTEVIKTDTPEGGTLMLTVNPEIAISYDKDGKVTEIKAINNDAKAIIEKYTGYIGKECRTVVAELVNKIGEAGYFVDDIDGNSRKITIEIEKGSKLPTADFLDNVVNEVKSTVGKNSWKSPIDLTGTTDYGITDYIDTDYGPNNDGVTDYYDTDYGVNNDGVTDYGRTDYGVTDFRPQQTTEGTTQATEAPKPVEVVKTTESTTAAPVRGNTDYGRTDYVDTDYGPNNDGVTDYYDTDYGPNNDGVTDYGNTDYGNTNYNDSNYNDSNYNNSDYGRSDYRD